LDQLSRSARGKKERPAIYLTDIDTIDRSGTSMLTDSKGLNPTYLKKGGRRRGLLTT
jgi:hypothetical protein